MSKVNKRPIGEISPNLVTPRPHPTKSCPAELNLMLLHIFRRGPWISGGVVYQVPGSGLGSDVPVRAPDRLSAAAPTSGNEAHPVRLWKAPGEQPGPICYVCM
jgi:hypothetical protein